MTVCPTNKTFSSDPFISLRGNPLIFRSLSKGFHPGIVFAKSNPAIDLLTRRTDRHEVYPARTQIAPKSEFLEAPTSLAQPQFASSATAKQQVPFDA